MKKIFVLGLLIVPIVANATDPVGPSAVPSGGTAVVATVSAPYQTAAPANGDSTTVVSASYVKGAYNDAIAAVNKVNNDKQAKLISEETGNNVETTVVGDFFINDVFVQAREANYFDSSVMNYGRDKLVTASGVLMGLKQTQNFLQEKLQEKLMDGNENAIDSYVYNADEFYNNLTDSGMNVEDFDNNLVTAGGVVQAFQDYTVKAVSTWGSNNTTNVHLHRPID